MNIRKVIRITTVLAKCGMVEPIINMIIQKVFQDDIICPGCSKEWTKYNKNCMVCNKCLFCKNFYTASDWSLRNRVCEDCSMRKGWKMCIRCGVLYNYRLGKKCWCSC